MNDNSHNDLNNKKTFFFPSQKSITREVDFGRGWISNERDTSFQKMVADIGDAVLFKIAVDHRRLQGGGEFDEFREE